MPTRVPWTRDELLVAFRLYCRTPFGKLHQHNPEIIDLARVLGRTPSAVGMKACNFASLDPAQQARGIKALGNLSSADRALWAQFAANSEAIAAEAETAYDRFITTAAPAPAPSATRRKGLTAPTAMALSDTLDLPEGPTEAMRTIRGRRVQGFFRSAVLSSYDFRCALSDLGVPELLNASHIIPWNANTERRADPRNGLCLNALYDRAFDRGLIALDTDLRVIVSPVLRTDAPVPFHRDALLALEGRGLRLPRRFNPDPAAVEYHRENVFRAAG